MRSVILITFVLLFLINISYCTEKFVYDSHGKRDPFVPLIGTVSEMSLSLEDVVSIDDIKLQGIAIDESGKVAILNGQVIAEGQTVGKVTLRKIEDEKVSLFIDGMQYEVQLYKEELDLSNDNRRSYDDKRR